MTDRCVEVCSPKGEMELLEVRKDITIDDLPTQSDYESLTWKARVRLMEVKQDVFIDHLLGKGDIYTVVDFK